MKPWAWVSVVTIPHIEHFINGFFVWVLMGLV